MKKFVILTIRRTGSTYIRLWLNNHPDVRCHGEIFLRKRKATDCFRHFYEQKNARHCAHHIFGNKILAKFPGNIVLNNLIIEYLDSLFHDGMHPGPLSKSGSETNDQSRRNPEDEMAVGFKLMYKQMRDYRFLQRWIKDNHLSIILLTRKNFLKMHLSRLLLDRGRVAHSSKKQKTEKVFVNPRTITFYLHLYKALTDRMSGAFSRNPCLEISYEDFFHNYSETSGRILEFLGLNRLALSPPPMKKLNPDSVREIIENYEEVAGVLKNTQYEYFLE